LPSYFSPIHRPSTNPSFAIDARSRYEFAEWTDVSGERLKVDIWGKVGLGWPGAENAGGISKGKEKERLGDGHQRPEWKVLEQWNVNLADLVPLPDDVSFL
jgi:UV radiation resistance-associated gene protein